MVYKSQSSVTIIYQTLKLLVTHVVLTWTLVTLDQMAYKSQSLVTIIYQTLKLLATHVVLTLVSLDQMAYKSQSSVTIIYQTLKLLVTHVVLTLVTLDQMVWKSIISYDIYQTLKTAGNSCCINLSVQDTQWNYKKNFTVKWKTKNNVKISKWRHKLTVYRTNSLLV